MLGHAAYGEVHGHLSFGDYRFANDHLNHFGHTHEFTSVSNPVSIQDMITWLVSGKIKANEEVVVGIDSMPSAMARMWTGDKLSKLVV